MNMKPLRVVSIVLGLHPPVFGIIAARYSIINAMPEHLLSCVEHCYQKKSRTFFKRSFTRPDVSLCCAGKAGWRT
jgi:hypothetical protein